MLTEGLEDSEFCRRWVNGLSELLDVLVSSAWAGARKPHPEIYRYTLDKAGLAPDEVLFVGDTWGPDVAGPLAAGMTPAYLERPGHWPDATRPADISGVPVARIRDLKAWREETAQNSARCSAGTAAVSISNVIAPCASGLAPVPGRQPQPYQRFPGVSRRARPAACARRDLPLSAQTTPASCGSAH